VKQSPEEFFKQAPLLAVNIYLSLEGIENGDDFVLFLGGWADDAQFPQVSVLFVARTRPFVHVDATNIIGAT
jgi:hypothetical protein